MNLKEKLYEIWLEYKQNQLNKEYEKKGLTDEILEKQIKINEKRNELNITDKNLIVNDNIFVQ